MRDELAKDMGGLLEISHSPEENSNERMGIDLSTKPSEQRRLCRGLGLGRAKPGFNGVYVICAEAAANIPEN